MFISSTSSVNSSWICLPDWRDWKNWSSFHQFPNDTNCFFLFQQQLNRPSGSIEPYIEFTWGLLLWLFSIPLNIQAVRNFKERKVNRQLLLLISLHAIFNFVITSTSLFKAISRLNEDFIIGDFGCISLFAVIGWTTTEVVWIDCIISVERLISVRSLFRKNRFKLTIFLIFTCSLINFTFYFYLFGIQSIAFTIPAFVHEVTRIVCILFIEALVGETLLLYISHFVLTFILPIGIIVGNYWSILKFVKDSRERLQSPSSNTTALTPTRFSTIGPVEKRINSRGRFFSSPRRSSNNPVIEALRKVRARRLETGLAFLMVTSVSLFIICILPAQVIFAYITYYDRYHGKRVESSAYYFSMSLVSLEACFNPFLPSLIRPSAVSSTVNRLFQLKQPADINSLNSKDLSHASSA